MKKVDILINKPIYVGVSILDMSKIRLKSDFNHIKKIFVDRVSLAYMDTDSNFL